MPHDPNTALTREQLHEIAIRRRDPDALALLHEIKRLRCVLVQAYQRARPLSRFIDDPDQAAALESFFSLIEDEPAIIEEASRPGARRVTPDTGPRWRHMSAEREAKLMARIRRG